MKLSESDHDEATRNVLFKSFKKENDIIDEVVQDVFITDATGAKLKTRN